MFRKNLTSTIFPVLIILLLVACACNFDKKKPNVVFLMTDDQGYGDLSVYGNPYVKTPNMDKLHDVSIRLTNYHAAPACTPTRSQLMTGIDAMHNGAYYAHGQHHLLNRKYTTLADAFKDNGYCTALYGKWHLGANSIGYRPYERGFDDAVYYLRGGVSSLPDPWNSDLMDDQYYHNGRLEQYEGYANDIWFDLGIEFINKCKKENQAFFLYLPVNSPHEPWLAPRKYREQYLNQGLDSVSVNFFAMISAVDDRLGALVSFLKSEMLWENTIFIFTSDNGSTLWHQEYNAGMRGKKASSYEGGHRVPFFISWPNGKLGSPRDINCITECQDVFPTLIDLCGLRQKSEILFDGLNISKIIRGKCQSEIENRVEVVQFEEEKYRGAVMYKNWRLVNGNELYNLANDPAQEINIAELHPQLADSLRGHYEKWWKEAQTAQLPPPYFVDGKSEIMLTAYDWYDGPRVFNWPHLRRGDRGNGKYRMFFEKEGKYTIELRRWPREANAGICDTVPAYTPFDPSMGKWETGKALNIVGARVKIGNQVQEMIVRRNDLNTKFVFDIPEGENQLQTWFIDADGNEFGAYYLYIMPG